jgi:hypothetical protein
VALWVWVLTGFSARADVGGTGVEPGFQGFGLSCHLGYGYGGDALGVTPNGGYPFYGGPGYPHSGPCLRRFGRISPYPYFAGPGYPSAEHPHFFEGVGPLIVNPPILPVEGGPHDFGSTGGFGPFSGTLPYPESFFAPFTAAAVKSGSSGTGGAPSPPAGPPPASR